MRLDGSDVQAITIGELPESALISRPVWVNSENRYYFNVSTQGNSDIYSVSCNGEDLLNLTDSPDFYEF